MTQTIPVPRASDQTPPPDHQPRSLDGSADGKSLAAHRPRAASGVVCSHLVGRDGPYYIIRTADARSYHRLDARDFFLWQRMDGEHTVVDLVVAYFAAYGSFALERVTGLTSALQTAGFLVNEQQPGGGQTPVRDPRERAATGWQSFLMKQFAVGGIDRLVAVLYARGGRLLFTRPAQVLFAAVSLIGVALYVRLWTSAWRPAGGSGGAAGALLWLVLLNLVSILLHELSHGLTVKHYGREVRRAGFMIYFGLPVFFVDTTDIWLEGKRARLAVSWAGPYSGLILAGICGIVLTIWPELPIGWLLFQFAFLALLTVFINLNPLLELDGYYLLMDWLEIPMLRRRSLAFLGSGLWQRLRAGQRWSREDRIFAMFGLLSALWTVYAVAVGIRFWQGQLAGSLDRLAHSAGGADLLPALAGLLISLVFIAALGVYPLQLARRGLHRLVRFGRTLAARQSRRPPTPRLTDPGADVLPLSQR
ncbi:MAG: M50 family metallopeptidase [Caldilineales bacterium]